MKRKSHEHEAELSQHVADDDAEDRIDEDELREYLMEEGLPIDAQNLHDAAQALCEMRASQRDKK